MQAETKDALLHAINEQYVEAVEVLLDHEESIHVEGEPWSWESLSEEEAVFSSDTTPLVLAAHTNNYEIIKILLDRGASLPCPHHHRCGCEECSGQCVEWSHHSFICLRNKSLLHHPDCLHWYWYYARIRLCAQLLVQLMTNERLMSTGGYSETNLDFFLKWCFQNLWTSFRNL